MSAVNVRRMVQAVNTAEAAVVTAAVAAMAAAADEAAVKDGDGGK